MAFMFSRRAVLAQLTAIPITASFARTLRAAGAPGASPGPRLIIFMQNNGVKRCNFWPTTGSGPEYALPPVGPQMPQILMSLFTSDGKTDNGLRAKTTLLKGLTLSGADGTNGNQHDIGFAKMFTGAPLQSFQGAPWGGAISLDQIICADWKTSSLTTAVYASQVESHPKAGFDHRKSFSYVGPHTLNYPHIDPYTAFNTAFPAMPTGNSSQDMSVQQRVALRKSVLDSVAGDLKDLQGRLGPDDAHKLDYHLTAIQQVEQQLQRMPVGGACVGTPVGAAPWFKPGGYSDNPSAPGEPDYMVTTEVYNDAMIQFMASLIAAAVKCNVYRVASLQFGYGGGKFYFGQQASGTPWLTPATTGDPMAGNISTNHHDSIMHHDTADDMSTGMVAHYVTWINEYYARTVQKVALEILNTPEGGGSMLDNTLIAWCTELGRGDHNMMNLPIVHIGMVGSGQKAGGRVIDYSAIRNGQAPANLHGYHILSALGHNITEPQWSPSGLCMGPAYSGY